VPLQGSLASASTFNNRYRRHGRKQGWNLAIHSLDHDEARDPRVPTSAFGQKGAPLSNKSASTISPPLCSTTASRRRSWCERTARFVLIERQHRLEAARALCEKTIVGFLVARGNAEEPTFQFARVQGLLGQVNEPSQFPIRARVAHHGRC
jgi:hypothetical protein